MLVLRRRRDLPIQGGFSLIEVLVTIVILAFGLLGLAALQVKVHGAGLEAVQRSQALLILEDIVARIDANRAQAAAYLLKTTTELAGCAEATDLALRDLCEWRETLAGTAVTMDDEDGNEKLIGGPIGAQGCIEELAAGPPRVLRVTVAWQGLVPTAAPSLGCGAGDYGSDDSLRRVVSTLVTIANLTRL